MYPQGIAGSVLAHKLKTPILLIGITEAEQGKVLDYLKTNLDLSGTVYILGGSGAVSNAIAAKVNSLGFQNITRLNGRDRYETAVEITANLEVKTGTPVILVSGESYPDALSVSSTAAILKYPILLIQEDGKDEEVSKKIAEIQPEKIYIIGGEGVISSAVQSDAAQIASLAPENIIRIGGSDRYKTSLAIANYFNLSGQNVCVATGKNFPDALAGSVYAAKNKAPIILIDGSLEDDQIDYLTAAKMIGVTLFGGEAVISKEIGWQLEQLIR